MRPVLACFLLTLLLLTGAVHPAVAEGTRLEPGGAGVVNRVVDGDTVHLEDGRRIRLVGIQAPKLPLGRPNVRKQPLADASKALLEKLVLGRAVALSYGGRRLDRHGRALAHLHTEDGRWVQGILLEQGLARVYSFPDNRTMVTDMLVLERAARSARRGIWRLNYYGIRTPDETVRHIDTFQLVEGEVLSAARVRGRTYLNFGEDWQSDFTITISKRSGRTFKSDGIDPLTWQGRRVRIRGWLSWRNGPMVNLTHPEQIEVLD